MNSVPQRSQTRAAAQRVMGWLLHGHHDLPARLHWLAQVERAELELRAQLAAWRSVVAEAPLPRREALQQELQHLEALLAQLRAKRLEQAHAARLGTWPGAADGPWLEWLRLLLEGDLANPSAQRAEQLLALRSAYLRRSTPGEE